MAIELTDDERKRVYAALQGYFKDNFDEDIGVLQTERLYELVVSLIGTAVHNRAITDAQAWMQTKLLDLDSDLHEP